MYGPEVQPLGDNESLEVFLRCLLKMEAYLSEVLGVFQAGTSESVVLLGLVDLFLGYLRQHRRVLSPLPE
jgi:hypothetical protein